MTEPKTWRCFHCDELFTTTMAARDHFGPYEDSTPACQIAPHDRGILRELRRVEIELSELWSKVHNDGTEAARSVDAQIGRHQQQLIAAEQAGYDRALADVRKTNPTPIPPPVLNIVENRPANCRNRLQDEGKPYPRSGCNHCKKRLDAGCPFEKGDK